MATYNTFEDLALSLYERYSVTLKFISQLRGGIPKSPDVQEGWIKATVSDTHRIDDLLAETAKHTGIAGLTEEALLEIKEATWNGFKSNGNGLFIEGRQVKAMIKEGASVLRELLNLAAFKSKVAERIFVEEDAIPLNTMTPDGSEESPVHAMTPQGPISALKRVDYVETPTLTFTIRALKTPLVTKAKDKIAPQAYVRTILEYCQDGGLGADRSQGYGKFLVEEFKVV